MQWNLWLPRVGLAVLTYRISARWLYPQASARTHIHTHTHKLQNHKICWQEYPTLRWIDFDLSVQKMSRIYQTLHIVLLFKLISKTFHSETLLRKCELLSPSRNYGSEFLFLYWQQPTSEVHLRPFQSIPHPHILRIMAGFLISWIKVRTAVKSVTCIQTCL